MNGLLNLNIKLSLEKIVKHCFYSNRMIDRICSLLSVKFVMPNTEKVVHPGLAHRYPALADDISGYMDDRGCTTIYGETPIGDQEYDAPIDCFNKMLELNLEMELLVKESITEAFNNGDYTTKAFLESFLLELISITKDILTVVDKAEMYGDSKADWMRFDHDFSDFNVFKVK